MVPLGGSTTASLNPASRPVALREKQRDFSEKTAGLDRAESELPTTGSGKPAAQRAPERTRRGGREVCV
jgi:hypothetical protein